MKLVISVFAYEFFTNAFKYLLRNSGFLYRLKPQKSGQVFHCARIGHKVIDSTPVILIFWATNGFQHHNLFDILFFTIGLWRFSMANFWLNFFFFLYSSFNSSPWLTSLTCWAREWFTVELNLNADFKRDEEDCSDFKFLAVLVVYEFCLFVNFDDI